MLLRNVLKTISMEIATIPLGVIVGILTARFLGPSDRGTFTLLLHDAGHGRQAHIIGDGLEG